MKNIAFKYVVPSPSFATFLSDLQTDTKRFHSRKLPKLLMLFEALCRVQARHVPLCHRHYVIADDVDVIISITNI